MANSAIACAPRTFVMEASIVIAINNRWSVQFALFTSTLWRRRPTPSMELRCRCGEHLIDDRNWLDRLGASYGPKAKDI
jgi:hypothetical protein